MRPVLIADRILIVKELLRGRSSGSDYLAASKLSTRLTF